MGFCPTEWGLPMLQKRTSSNGQLPCPLLISVWMSSAVVGTCPRTAYCILTTRWFMVSTWRTLSPSVHSSSSSSSSQNAVFLSSSSSSESSNNGHDGRVLTTISGPPTSPRLPAGLSRPKFPAVKDFLPSQVAGLNFCRARDSPAVCSDGVKHPVSTKDANRIAVEMDVEMRMLNAALCAAESVNKVRACVRKCQERSAASG
mmetsp:Transcript_80856/g.121535  ORF Transcript_80856/g.121535 Transcript_80856/m.121535 type:complete len:202 (-) Transcript_80856:36-641(-)